MKNKISVLSGGLDSTILTYKLVKEFGRDRVIALTFDYQQRHSVELDRAKLTCTKLDIKHRVIDIGFLDEIIAPVSALSSSGSVETPNIEDVLGDPQPTSYVPNRNMMLTAIAFSFAECNNADEVYAGFQAVDQYGYWDTSDYFVQNMNSVIGLNRLNKIQLVAPFVNWTKKDEIILGQMLGVPFEDTWSCYNPQIQTPNANEYYGGGVIVYGTTPSPKCCGRCPTCSERIMNFSKAGLKDPVSYAINIDWDKLIRDNQTV